MFLIADCGPAAERHRLTDSRMIELHMMRWPVFALVLVLATPGWRAGASADGHESKDS